jgi:hypothetical protein
MGALDDFRNDFSRNRNDENMLKENTPAEWVALQGFAQDLAEKGETIDDIKFQWVSDFCSPCLVLENIGAYFICRKKADALNDYRICFDRRPTWGRWHDEMRLKRVEWSLQPVLQDGTVFWLVSALGKTPLSSADLADKIAVKVAQYRIEYKKCYENWTAV